MTDLFKERALRVGPDDVFAMLEIAEGIKWAPEALPDQIAAADSVKRSIESMDKSPTDMKLKVLKARWAKLLLTL